MVKKVGEAGGSVETVSKPGKKKTVKKTVISKDQKPKKGSKTAKGAKPLGRKTAVAGKPKSDLPEGLTRPSQADVIKYLYKAKALNKKSAVDRGKVQKATSPGSCKWCRENGFVDRFEGDKGFVLFLTPDGVKMAKKL